MRNTEHDIMQGTLDKVFHEYHEMLNEGNIITPDELIALKYNNSHELRIIMDKKPIF